MQLFHRCYLGIKYITNSKIKPLILFASSPVGFPILKTLHQYTNQLIVVTHMTQTNKKNINQVQIYCQNNNIPCYFPVSKEQNKQQKYHHWQLFINNIKNLSNIPKLGIVCSYGYLIPNQIIQLFQKSMIVAHPSLIPKYRGGSPIFHAIANGQKQSGISFLQLSKNKFDHGNLLYQTKIPLNQKDSYLNIQKLLSQLIANQAIYVIEHLDTLRPGKKQQQLDITGIPPHQLQAKIIKTKYLDISKSAQQLYNWSRALPSPRIKFQDIDIIIHFDKIFKQDPNNQHSPGQLKLFGKKLYMKCKDKFILLISWQQINKRQFGIHTFVDKFIRKSSENHKFFFK